MLKQSAQLVYLVLISEIENIVLIGAKIYSSNDLINFLLRSYRYSIKFNRHNRFRCTHYGILILSFFFLFFRAINTGVMHPSSFVGIHAGDVESYQMFSEIFYPIIEQYHVGYKIGSSRHTTDLNPSHLKGELSSEAKKLIISTRIRVARNLQGFPLNPGGTKESRLQIESLMASVFTRLPTELAGEYFSHAKMSPEREKMLIDAHFLFKVSDIDLLTYQPILLYY